jgi:hypothetical protein
VPLGGTSSLTLNRGERGVFWPPSKACNTVWGKMVSSEAIALETVCVTPGKAYSISPGELASGEELRYDTTLPVSLQWQTSC